MGFFDSPHTRKEKRQAKKDRQKPRRWADVPNVITGGINRLIGNKFGAGSFLNTSSDSYMARAKRFEIEGGLLEKVTPSRQEPFNIYKYEECIKTELNVHNLDWLGSGAFGFVFSANTVTNEQQRDEKVVIKAVGAEYDSKMLRRIWFDRARREPYYMRKAAHPNVIKIFDFIFINNVHGKPGYLVMKTEFADTDLAKVIRKHKFSLKEMTRLASQIGTALVYLHKEVGLVHHDLKPANIVLGPMASLDDEDHLIESLKSVTYKLIDFNLAKEYSGDYRSVKETRSRGGTHFYMPLEKYINRVGYNPALSDVFGFGTILFESLVGTERFSNYAKVRIADYQEAYAREIAKGLFTQEECTQHVVLIKAIGRLIGPASHRDQVEDVMDVIKTAENKFANEDDVQGQATVEVEAEQEVQVEQQQPTNDV